MLSSQDLRKWRGVAVLTGLFGLLVAMADRHDAFSAQGKGAILRVSHTGHYLLRDGVPFFWLGDTTWSLVNRYTKEEAEVYLEHRRKQGFTVEQMMLLFDGGPGLTTLASNAEGAEPLLNTNPATPNEAYFKHVDHLIA